MTEQLILLIVSVLGIAVIIIMAIYTTYRVNIFYDELPAQIRRKILKDQCRTQIYVQRYLEGYTR